MENYKINKEGEVVFEDENRVVPNSNPLWEEFTKLEYEVMNNHHNPTKDPVKIARYNELKKLLNVEKSNKALGEAMEKAKRKIIAADKSSDNSVLYAAMAKFKKRNA